MQSISLENLELIKFLLVFFFFLFLGIVLILINRFLSPQNPTREKLLPYECGLDPIDDAREKFHVKYYLIALIFLVFDVEIVFLYPWAIAFEKLGQFAFWEVLIFILLLLIAYVYAWEEGGLEWEEEKKLRKEQ